MKQVRFHEKVKIIEIQRFDQILEDVIGHEIIKNITEEDSDTLESDCNIDRSNTESSIRSSVRVSSTQYGPIKKPARIPSMLFNSLPVPNTDPTSSSSPSKHINRNCQRSIDLRWRGFETNRSKVTSLAPSAPIRIPSLEHILDNTLALLETIPSSAKQTRRLSASSEGLAAAKRFPYDSDGVSSKINRPWDRSEPSTACKRRMADRPPILPCRNRKISKGDYRKLGNEF